MRSSTQAEAKAARFYPNVKECEVERLRKEDGSHCFVILRMGDSRIGKDDAEVFAGSLL